MQTFVDGEQGVAVGRQSETADVFAVLERKRNALVTGKHAFSKYARQKHRYIVSVLHKVQHADAISDRTEDTVSIRSEDEIPLFVKSAT